MSDKKQSSLGPTSLLVKFGGKVLTFLPKLLKVLKIGKVALFAGTFASYAYLLSWKFAAAIMLMLLVHEGGHIWAMRRVGIRTKGIYFLPFLGGAAVGEGDVSCLRDLVFIALAGPAAGLALSLVVVAAWHFYPLPWLAAIAGWWAFVNLANLLPITPLDGGHVLNAVTHSLDSAVGKWAYLIGLLFGEFVAIKTGIYLFAFFGGIAVIDGVLGLFRHRERRIAFVGEEATALSGMEMGLSLISYVGLAAVLFLAMNVMKHEPGAALALEALRH